MRIFILTIGTRGDVQPYVALAHGLIARGHSVDVMTHADYQGMLTEYSVPHIPIKGSIHEAFGTKEGEQLLSSGTNNIQSARAMAKLAIPYANELGKIAEAARNADVIICNFMAIFAAINLHDGLKRPIIIASLQPLAPTYETFGMPQRPLPPFLRWLKPLGWYGNFQKFGWRLYSKFFAEQSNVARKAVFGLPPRRKWLEPEFFRDPQFAFLYGFSRHLVPRPGDWSPTQHITGYWFLPMQAKWQPPADLVAFLEAGPPPVYFGFGSMREASVQGLVDLVGATLKLTNQRGVMISGWSDGEVQRLPENLFVSKNLPHEWLFPKMAAVVHHGGAGTTAAGLRAGVPNIIVPYMADQPYWGRRVYTMGAGPVFFTRKQATPERLAASVMEALNNPTMRATAARIGEGIRAEDGVTRAAELIERFAQTGDATKLGD